MSADALISAGTTALFSANLVSRQRLDACEHGHEVEYLHQVVPGLAEKSYGIYVAQLAGLPKPVIHRATELLSQLNGATLPQAKAISDTATRAMIELLATLDINQLSPVEALTKPYELQQHMAELRKR